MEKTCQLGGSHCCERVHDILRIRGSMAKMFKEATATRKQERDIEKSSDNEEDVQAEEFIAQETLGAIDALVNNNKDQDQLDSILMPPPGIQRQKVRQD